MAPPRSGLLVGVVVAVLLVAGCDMGDPDQESPPTIDRVSFSLTSLDEEAAHQTLSVHRRTDSFRAPGRLLLPPGEYRIRLEAYDDNESVMDYLTEGESSLLRYARSEGLQRSLSVRQFAVPDLLPLDTTLASGRSASPSPKRSPVPPPGFFVTVMDTAEAAGTLRLVWERYATDADYREGADPLRVDFDLRLPLRTVPAAQE